MSGSSCFSRSITWCSNLRTSSSSDIASPGRPIRRHAIRIRACQALTSAAVAVEACQEGESAGCGPAARRSGGPPAAAARVRRIDGDAEPVGEACQVVEDADDVRDLQAVLVAEAERAQAVPVRPGEIVRVK